MVRLLTVIGHGVNLLPHFIKHYKRYVDEINIAIYKTDLYPTLEEDINEISEFIAIDKGEFSKQSIDNLIKFSRNETKNYIKNNKTIKCIFWIIAICMNKYEKHINKSPRK